MGLILLEALLALSVFVFLVWWTMFSGRRPEVPPDASPEVPPREHKSPDDQDGSTGG